MIASRIQFRLPSDLAKPGQLALGANRLAIRALASAVACVLPFVPLPASAQAVLSGGLTVQMQVGSRTTSTGPQTNGGAQTLGANTTDCTASTVPMNFGRITLTSAGGFPRGPGGQVLNIDADGKVLITCRPAGNPNGPGTSSVGIQLSSSHPLGPQYLMTLNNSASTQGITYNVYKNPSRTSGVQFLPSDTVTATVQADSTQDITSVDLYGRVGVPLFSNGIPAGTYRDFLTVNLFF
ncbi:spore coat protein U domain-containing protein [Aquisediminimonas profunda]|uniref:spore coat protein U domain-containing protein n=1 Tax=Aquisediminimonas profunda TaxID=1550733 RepID=UPI001C62F5A9|nr:spore coat protein U domain-containing protein [Aquisediminimonas profunda]